MTEHKGASHISSACGGECVSLRVCKSVLVCVCKSVCLSTLLSAICVSLCVFECACACVCMCVCVYPQSHSFNESHMKSLTLLLRE